MAPLYISKDHASHGLLRRAAGGSAGRASPWRRNTASPSWAATPWRAHSTPAFANSRADLFQGPPMVIVPKERDDILLLDREKAAPLPPLQPHDGDDGGAP